MSTQPDQLDLSDHAARARQILTQTLEHSQTDENTWALVSILAAQVEATLALVEQQRLANLLALGTVADGVLAEQPATDARAALVVYREHDDPDLGGWLDLRPEVARLLGIGDTDE